LKLRQMTKIGYHIMRLHEEIMAKKPKLWHFSTPLVIGVSQGKSHMVSIFGSVRQWWNSEFHHWSGHLSKGYFLTKQRADSPHSYESACLTDRQTDGCHWTAIWQAQLTKLLRNKWNVGDTTWKFAKNFQL
jgi:hypothetical protein